MSDLESFGWQHNRKYPQPPPPPQHTPITLCVNDVNPGPRYDTLLLRMIPGDLLSAFPHRQFHTLPGL